MHIYVCTLAVLFVLTACEPSIENKIIGKWQVIATKSEIIVNDKVIETEEINLVEEGYQMYITFNADGKGSMIEVNMGKEYGDDFTWTLTDGTLTMSYGGFYVQQKYLVESLTNNEMKLVIRIDAEENTYYKETLILEKK